MTHLPAPEPLTPEAFAPFGWVLRRDPAGEPFQTVHAEATSRGWRVALLEVPAGPLRRVHRHPDSEECFVPLVGAPALVVAEPDAPDALRVFRLDEPVCVRRHVWHEIVSADAARVFIAENASVSGQDRYLDPPLRWSATARTER